MARRLMRAAATRWSRGTAAPDAVQARARAAAGASVARRPGSRLQPPRAVWMMVPAGDPTEQTVDALAERLQPGDTIIDGGNSHFKDDVRRAAALERRGHPLRRRRHERRRLGRRARLLPDDRRRAQHAVARLDADLPHAGARARRASRRPAASTPRTRRRTKGFLHCGPAGAGHFVKMIHNGIEYGLMQSYAEGFDILRNATEHDAARGPSLRLQPRRDRRSLAARQRRQLVAARSCGAGADRGSAARTVCRHALPTRAKGAGRCRRRSRRDVPGRRPDHRALRPLPLAQRSHVRGEAAVGAPRAVRRPCRTSAADPLRPRDLRRVRRSDAPQAAARHLQPCGRRTPAGRIRDPRRRAAGDRRGGISRADARAGAQGGRRAARSRTNGSGSRNVSTTSPASSTTRRCSRG